MNFLNSLPALQGWRAAWAWGVVLVLAMRLGLGLMMGATWLALKPYLPATLVADPRVYDGLPTYPSSPGDAVLGVWLRWDAVHLLNLARLGYFQVTIGDSVYYPLYPLVTRFVTPLVGGDYVVGGLLVSTLAAIVAFACLYRLAEQLYGDDVARWTVVAWAVYPTAFFLIAPFTEALFMALTLGAFVAACGRRWWLAGVLGALASLTRGLGLLTVVALAWIAWEQWRAEGRGLSLNRSNVRHALTIAPGLILPPLGGYAFTLWRDKVGFPSMTDVLGTYSSGLVFTDPLRGLWAAVVQWLTVRDLPTTLDVVSAFIFIGLMIAMAINPRWRRAEWLLYMGINLAFTVSIHTVRASYLQSLARYVLALFPAFIVIGDWLAQRGPRVHFVYLILSSSLLVVLSALYALWWFIG